MKYGILDTYGTIKKDRTKNRRRKRERKRERERKGRIVFYHQQIESRSVMFQFPLFLEDCMTEERKRGEERGKERKEGERRKEGRGGEGREETRGETKGGEERKQGIGGEMKGAKGEERRGE